MVKVLPLLLSTEWLEESWLHRQALALHLSLAAAYMGDPSNKSIVQLSTYFISLATDETVIEFCPYVGTFPSMEKWGHALRVDAVLECLQCVMNFSYFTLRPAVKNTSRLVVKRWFIVGWGCPFSLHSVTFDLSLQVWLQDPQKRRFLQQKTAFYLEVFIHLPWNIDLHDSLSFWFFSEIISWGIHRKTNSRFFTILGEGWRQIQLQNTSYFKCKMILP